MKKAAIILILVALIGGAYVVLRPQSVPHEPISSASSEQNPSSRQTAPDLIIGSADAPVTITEYGDFKCPTCNRFVRGASPEIRKQYIDTNNVKILFRNLPFIAADSRTAAEGAYCANSQGKFTQYHDAAYNYIWDNYYVKGKISEGEAAEVFTVDRLASLIAQNGGNADSFKTCMQNGQFKEAVTADLSQSERDSVTGTPTFIIGGQKVVGAQSYNFFKTLIDAQLR